MAHDYVSGRALNVLTAMQVAGGTTTTKRLRVLFAPDPHYTSPRLLRLLKELESSGLVTHRCKKGKTFRHGYLWSVLRKPQTSKTPGRDVLEAIRKGARTSVEVCETVPWMEQSMVHAKIHALEERGLIHVTRNADTYWTYAPAT